MLRCLMLGRLGKFGDSDVVAESQRRFKAHIDGVEPIPADIRGAVYRYILLFL